MVRLGGQIIKEMVTRAIFKRLMKLIYFRHSMTPLDNLEFITVI